MAHRFDGRPLLTIVPESSEPATGASSEPIVLGFFVAEALRNAGLAHAVLRMRGAPAEWVDFLMQLHYFLEMGPSD